MASSRVAHALGPPAAACARLIASEGWGETGTRGMRSSAPWGAWPPCLILHHQQAARFPSLPSAGRVSTTGVAAWEGGLPGAQVPEDWKHGLLLALAGFPWRFSKTSPAPARCLSLGVVSPLPDPSRVLSKQLLPAPWPSVCGEPRRKSRPRKAAWRCRGNKPESASAAFFFLMYGAPTVCPLLCEALRSLAGLNLRKARERAPKIKF